MDFYLNNLVFYEKLWNIVTIHRLIETPSHAVPQLFFYNLEYNLI